MRFLVAGGAGFVGGHLCRRLVEAGHGVTCVDNLVTGRLENVADLVGDPSFMLVERGVTELREADLDGRRPDVVLHLASPASPVDYDRLPLETLEANSAGTWRLLEVAAASRARFVYASTSEVYGDPLVHPQPETYFGNVDPVGPRACYDEGKRFGEALVVSFRRVHGLRAAIVRIFNTYGPSMRLDDGRVVPAFLAAARSGRPLPVQGDGSQTRSYQYVSDLVDALVLIGCDEALDGQILNIGNPQEVTVLELAERVAAIAGARSGVAFVPGRAGDPRQRCPDISRMRQRYGWEPRVDLDEGLRRTVDWLDTTIPAIAGGQGGST